MARSTRARLPWMAALLAAACGSAGSDAGPGGAAGPGTWVTGYYAGWYPDLYPPERVDMTAMTHFVFGRAAPGGGGAGGSYGQVIMAAGPTGNLNATPLVQRAHAAGTKALLMLGGAGDYDAWYGSTSDAVRPAFVRNVLAALDAHGFDGVDVDWEEFLDGSGGYPDTQRRVLALLADLRAARPGIILAFPGPWLSANDGRAPAFFQQVADAVDQFNIMSYAMAGDWGGWDTWFFAALAGHAASHPSSIAATVAAYRAAGIPAARLGIGIGFYGINYVPHPAWLASTAYAPGTHVLSGLDAYRCILGGTSAASGGPAGTGSRILDGSAQWAWVGRLGPRADIATLAGVQNDDNEWMYANLAEGYLGHGTKVWDDVAMQNSLVFPGGYTPTAPGRWSRAGYISYEDEQSIAAKGAWVRAQGLGGAIAWTINYGCTDPVRGTNPLLAAMKAAFLR